MLRILAAVLLVLCSFGYAEEEIKPFPAGISICGKMEDAKDIIPEVVRLNAKYPVPFFVVITFIGKDVDGFYMAKQSPNVRYIFITPKSDTAKRRIAVLRHEWQHVIQEMEGRLLSGNDEENNKEARAAEGGVLKMRKKSQTRDNGPKKK